MKSERTNFVAAVIGLIVLGLLGTFEVWQALNYDVIGFRNGGIVRAEDPILFWIAFCVSMLIAAPVWLAVIFIALILILRLASRKAF